MEKEMLSNVIEPKVVPIAFSELQLHQLVGTKPSELNLKVIEIKKVVGVHVTQSKLGTSVLNCSDLSLLPTLEPRVMLQCLNGSWSAYWYPLQALFVTIDTLSGGNKIVSIKRCVFLYGTF